MRRDRNRRAVVDALLDLFAEGNLRPSTAEIAGRAGLSPRSLFRYFDDIDDLGRAAIERQQQRACPLLRIEVGPDASLAAKVDALLAQRTRLFEAVAAAATVSRLRAPFQPVLAAELTKSRAALRGQIAELLGPELAALGMRAAGALAAADVLCSFESHQLLRFDQGLPVATVRAVLASALAALLTPASATATTSSTTSAPSTPIATSGGLAQVVGDEAGGGNDVALLGRDPHPV
jgi:TetR/AcrR family transcriptional regulator of autoinduction and epiphytic fitness